MLLQTREDDLTVFSDIAGYEYQGEQDVPQISAPFIYDLGIKDGFYDWLFNLHTVCDNRSCRCERADVDGYDDAFTYDDIDAFQTYAFRISGRVDLGNAIIGR